MGGHQVTFARPGAANDHHGTIMLPESTRAGKTGAAVGATHGPRTCFREMGGRRRRAATTSAPGRLRPYGVHETDVISQRQLVRLMPWLAILALLAVWELVCRLFHLREFVLPAP